MTCLEKVTVVIILLKSDGGGEEDGVDFFGSKGL